MNTKNIAIGLLTLIWIIMALLLYKAFKQDKAQKEEAAYWRNKAFKTDTIIIQDHYESQLKLQPIYKEAAPPKIVIQYQPYIPDNVLKFQDSVLQVIDSLKGITTSISPLFLRRFPDAHKLIKADFTKDTLKLDLLNIQGNIFSEVYPIDYSAFNYQYQNNSLSASELKTRLDINNTHKKKIFRYDGTYLYYDRDLLKGEHQVGATFGFDVWKLRLQGWSQHKLGTQANLNGGVRVGYRLF